jgi:hypothetical protein
MVSDLERYNSSDSDHASEESVFFTNDQYKEHSKQLVDALREWAEQIKFINCEYANGELQIRNEILFRPAVRYMGLMLKHLESAYNDTFPDIDQIQSERISICNEIRDLMTTHFGPKPHKPSYDMIVNDEIKKSCPNLERIKDLDLDISSNNFYSSNKITQMIFEVVSGRRNLDLTVNPSSVNGLDLLDKKIKTIARGDESSILRLKSTLERLVSNSQVGIIVRQYHVLKNKLDNDSGILNLRIVVTKFHDFIHAAGPIVLGGPGSCDICSGAEFRIK